MDYIRKYDIELEKEYYYAGEVVRGCVSLENLESLRVNGIQVFIRGKAHVEWRITRGGERRTVKEDQFFIDEKAIIWGKESGVDEGASSGSVLPAGDHRFPFDFQLPNAALPCSFESRVGSVRYYLRVVVDIPYKSPPQGLKYFTIIGPYIDSLDAKYLTRQTAFRQRTSRCLWCASSPVSLEVSLERSSYCCGQRIKVHCDVQNGSDQPVTLVCRLIQAVDYRIAKGSVVLNKEATHTVLELQSQPIQPRTADVFQDLDRHLRLPVMPPTMHDVCKLIDISYILRVSLHVGKSEEELQAEFSIIVSTVPHQIISNELTDTAYEPADDRVEGGNYISPEFQLGQVYDGEADVVADVVLYRPVYVCLESRPESKSAAATVDEGDDDDDASPARPPPLSPPSRTTKTPLLIGDAEGRPEGGRDDQSNGAAPPPLPQVLTRSAERLAGPALDGSGVESKDGGLSPEMTLNTSTSSSQQQRSALGTFDRDHDNRC